MSLFLYFIFIFYIGSTCGYFLELFFRKIFYKKWVNPGFLIGPYLPIYGFGLCVLTLIYLIFNKLSVSPFIIIIMMGFCMTLIEFIGGLSFLNGGGVKLWDYSSEKFNYKGIICLKFSLIWTVLGAIYYYFIANRILNALEWFTHNLSFSFILGIFFGIIVIDYIYSTKTLVKIGKFSKDNNIIVKYEEFKCHIKELQEKSKDKYSFILPFKQNKTLIEYLTFYKNYKNKK